MAVSSARPPARCAGVTNAIPGSRSRAAVARARSRSSITTWSRLGAPEPERPLDERVALARVGIVRHDADRRHPGAQARARARRGAAGSATAAAPYGSGRAQRRRPQAAKRSLRWSAALRRRIRPPLILWPRADSAAGSSVSVAARTESTASTIPSGTDRNVGTGTSMTASSAAMTVRPLASTALPAVPIVCTVASRGDSPAASAPRKRTTMKSA